MWGLCSGHRRGDVGARRPARRAAARAGAPGTRRLPDRAATPRPLAATAAVTATPPPVLQAAAIAAADEDAALQQPLLTPLACLSTHSSAAALPVALCEPAPPPQRSQRWQPPGGDAYCAAYLAQAAWLAALLGGYSVQRVACQLGLPSDGLRHLSSYELFADLTSVALFGLVLGWFVGVACPRRFAWLFCRRRWYMWLVMTGTPPVYSAIRCGRQRAGGWAISRPPWAAARGRPHAPDGQRAAAPTSVAAT